SLLAPLPLPDALPISVADVRLDDRQHQAVRLLERAVARAGQTQELVTRDLEVPQVVPVVDEPHLIRVAVDHAIARDVAKLDRLRSEEHTSELQSRVDL